MQLMVDNTDIVETIAPNTGIAIPKISPVKSMEEHQREALLSRISSEVSELQSGPQSDDIKDAIRQLQGLSNQVRLGMVSVSVAASRFSAVATKAEAEVRETYAKESIELIKSINYAAQAEQFYRELSIVARARVDLVHNLLCKKGPLSHDEQVTVISNLALPEEQIGTKLGKDTANTLLEMNPEAMAELQANPEGAKTGHTIVEKNRKDIKHIIEAPKDPQIKKHLKEGAIFACPNAATVGKMGQCHTAAAAKEFAEDAIATFKAEGAKHYADFLSATTTNTETREILEKNGGFKGAINRMKEMSGSEARLAAAERYANGDTTGATDEIKADAAALRAVLAVGSSRELGLIREIARKQKEYGIEKLTQRERDIINADIAQERRGELMGEIQYERAMAAYGGGQGKDADSSGTRTLEQSESAKKFFTNIAVSAVKTSDKKYPNPQDILSATPDDMRTMSQDAANGVAQAMWDNFLTTNKKNIAETAQMAADEARAQAAKEGKTKIEQDQAAVDAKKWVQVGGEFGALGGHIINLEGGKALEVAGTLATKAQHGISSWIDSGTEAIGIHTFSNQVAKNMDAMNSIAVFTAVTNGNGEKIFDKDKSGKISQAEMEAVLAKHGIHDIRDLDKDKNNAVSQAEMTAALNKIVKEERAAGSVAKVEDAKALGAQVAKNLGSLNGSAALKAVTNGNGQKIFDTDKDGKLSQTEIEAALNKHGITKMGQIDKNGDGISEGELIGVMNKIIKDERAAGAAEKIKADVAKLLPKLGEVKFSPVEKTLFGGADGKIDLSDRDNILAVLKREGVDLSKFDKDKNGLDVKELGEAMHAASTHAAAKKPAAKAQGH